MKAYLPGILGRINSNKIYVNCGTLFFLEKCYFLGKVQFSCQGTYLGFRSLERNHTQIYLLAECESKNGCLERENGIHKGTTVERKYE
jgi:hypothetical protein